MNPSCNIALHPLCLGALGEEGVGGELAGACEAAGLVSGTVKEVQ